MLQALVSSTPTLSREYYEWSSFTTILAPKLHMPTYKPKRRRFFSSLDGTLEQKHKLLYVTSCAS
jgi:hypothetical protein